MFCPQCGRPVNDAAKFCPHCGHAFLKKSVVSETQKDSAMPSYDAVDDDSSSNCHGKYTATSKKDTKKSNNLSGKRPLKKYMIGGSVAVIALIVVVLYMNASGFFNPNRVKESGSYELGTGESVYLDSIDSTLEFTQADIEAINYDALTLNLNWTLCLTPEESLNPDDSRQYDLCADWISDAYYSGENSVSSIETRLDYGENCVWYDLSTTVYYDETIESLQCVVSDNLIFELQYTFPYSPEQILMGKADSYLSSGQYDQALELYQEIGTDEAFRKVQSINCIDYANQIINYLNVSYTPAANLLGMDTTFEFDVESYTFYEHRYLPSYMDSVSGWFGIDYGFGDEYGDGALNEEANIERAKELYAEYFATDGFPDITCTLVVYKSSGEWLGEFSYPDNRSDDSASVDNEPTNETFDNQNDSGLGDGTSYDDDYSDTYGGYESGSGTELNFYYGTDTATFESLLMLDFGPYDNWLFRVQIPYTRDSAITFSSGSDRLNLTILSPGIIELYCESSSFEGVPASQINGTYYLVSPALEI